MEASWQMRAWMSKNQKMYKIDKDFKLFEIIQDETKATAVELMVEDYEGVVYRYHQARVVEENGVAKLQYGYTILDSGNKDIDVLNSDEKFFTIMGDILQVILIDKIENEQTRTDYPEESNPQ
jgi:hypothetical protein